MVHIQLLRQLLGVTRLDCQRNPDIYNILKVDNVVEDKKLYQQNWFDHLKRMDRSCLQKLAFQYQPRGQRNFGRPRRRWSDQANFEFKGTSLKT
jgi:hypothetical protein